MACPCIAAACTCATQHGRCSHARRSANGNGKQRPRRVLLVSVSELESRPDLPKKRRYSKLLSETLQQTAGVSCEGWCRDQTRNLNRKKTAALAPLGISTALPGKKGQDDRANIPEVACRRNGSHPSPRITRAQGSHALISNSESRRCDPTRLLSLGKVGVR